MNKLEFYKKPFRIDNDSYWVYDANNNFVFQFEAFEDENNIKESMNVINGKGKSTNSFKADFENKEILIKTPYGEYTHYITIRGWGNLTGRGAHNLSVDRATEIQDIFTRWLLGTLNGTL